MNFVSVAASVVASILLMLGLHAGVDRFYPKGDVNTYGAQIQVTAVPIVRAAVVKEETPKPEAPAAANLRNPTHR